MLLRSSCRSWAQCQRLGLLSPQAAWLGQCSRARWGPQRCRPAQHQRGEGSLCHQPYSGPAQLQSKSSCQHKGFCHVLAPLALSQSNRVFFCHISRTAASHQLATHLHTWLQCSPQAHRGGPRSICNRWLAGACLCMAGCRHTLHAGHQAGKAAVRAVAGPSTTQQAAAGPHPAKASSSASASTNSCSEAEGQGKE